MLQKFLLSIIVGMFFVMLITQESVVEQTPTEQVLAVQAPTTVPQKPPEQKILENDYHVFQTFNNCGPASLSMALSHYGINENQETLGQALRPYQVENGDNDDKSVTLEEMAEKAKEYGLIPYHRPNGTIELLKHFIANDMPVITRTWLEPNEDIGHYRVVKGYNSAEQNIIQDDSYQGKNLLYSQGDFTTLWEKFNYEYLVLVPKDKQNIAEAILGEDVDAKVAWQKAARLAQGKLEKNPNDVTARFNLSVAYYNIGEYQKSVEEFEKVEAQLPARTLWYQIEPILSYFELGKYDRVFLLTDQILNNDNRAFSELYIVRAKVYKAQGRDELVEPELEKARMYHVNLKIPKV